MKMHLVFALLLACRGAYAESIPLIHEHGTLQVPVLINGKFSLNFTIDSGAADVSVPADVFSTLVRTGTVSTKDLLEIRAYTLADGSKQSSQLFHIASLKIGTLELLDVIGSIAPASGPLLLGQSFLARLPSWSIDNRRQLLLIDASPTSVTRDVVMHSREC
jgi:predicted aspartyl protease